MTNFLRGFAAAVSRAKAAGIAVFVSFALVFSALPDDVAAQSFRFTNVQIEGNQRVDGATILSYTGIERGVPIEAGALNEAYQNVVNSGLFESVEFEPRGNTLLIRVVEFPTINLIAFEGNRILKDDVLADIIVSQSRRVYSPSRAEADAAEIVNAYAQSGRIAATVEPKIIRRSDNRVDLVFEILEGRVIEIERISFVGNRAFSERRLRGVLETKQAGLLRRFVRSDTFIGDRIDFDRQVLSDFYASRGYIDFQVLGVSSELTRQRDAFLLTFNVQEGQQFDVGEISVVSDLEEVDVDEYLAALKLSSGKTYSPELIEQNIARLERKAVQQGLDFVRVDPRITRNDRDLLLDVEFAVVRGPRIFVERIDIEGNATTLDRVIRRQFDTVEGDPFNPREIRETAERIRALGFFSTAEVNAREGSSPSQVVVDVDVEEQPTGSLSFGAAYSATNGIGLTASFNESNFLGRGQTLAFSFATGTDNRQGTLTFFEPAILGRDVGFRVTGSYAETNDQNSNLYDTQAIAFSPSIEFPLADFSRFGLNYTFEQTELSNYTGSSALIAAETARGSETRSSLGFSYEFDTRRTGLNPDAGVLVRFSQDIAGVGGDLNQLETSLLVGAETLAFGDVELRAEAEAGFLQTLNGTSRLTDRFFGNGKIRGFDFNGFGPRDTGAASNDALGGNQLLAIRLEAEFPLGIPEEYGIRGGLFADFGSVWGLDNNLGGTIDDSFALRSVVGASIFWDTAIGPLRFNFTRALQKESFDEEQRFDLTISTRF
ncbi:outer membrane protein assembly complex, YaeT protein [Actibacterium mucosum KCTC 23349]|uniref:Outer membrane protein assembly factor BamA n=1 Tax=Actibacterium mucosum KCTC 23349 TaxID=1454373 RepID=A0A037ZMT5_9RHOB|nr:outer membrane protein assembly factor BamA [Actibacterium mucosum]KAJ56873.1 outer membrane protein assembly complex, YaeT protein [Actibacterium mucosum KCTC 23349]